MALNVYEQTLQSHFRGLQPNSLSPFSENSNHDAESSPAPTVVPSREGNTANEAHPSDTHSPTAIENKAFLFADITEIKTKTLHGEGIEVLPTQQFAKSPRTTEAAIRKFAQYSVLLRRTVVQHPDKLVHFGTDLEIQSLSLQRLLRDMMRHVYDNVDLQANPIRFPSPYCELFFHREKIREFVDNSSNPPALRQEMKILLDFMYNKKEILLGIIREHERIPVEAAGTVTAQLLWTIYPPGELMVLRMDGIEECYICQEFQYREDDSGKWFEVTGARMDFDGRSAGLAKKTVLIPWFRGRVNVTDLPLVPKAFIQDWTHVEQRMRERGTVWSNLLRGGPSHCFFSGPVWEVDPQRRVLNRKPTFQFDERVMIDYTLYLEENPDLRPTFFNPGKQKEDEGHAHQQESLIPMARNDAFKSNRTKPHRMAERALSVVPNPPRPVMTDSTNSNVDLAACLDNLPAQVGQGYDPLLLFPARIPAFGLKEKRWGWLMVDDVQRIDWKTAALDALQIDPKLKYLMLALVKGHATDYSRSAPAFDDIIPGKGKGLVFLLKGQPGLGKTLTAECIAEYCQRPLYSISAGELTTDVPRLETQLGKIFKKGRRWQAVVLLDEADVLLSQRALDEISRNAIVAVFLRMIEYYEGILFLTTNRDRNFDEAILNRIHLAVTYPPHDANTRSIIWQGLVERNFSLKTDCCWTEEAYTQLGQLKLNGREIKNTLRTADAFARSEGQSLSIMHIVEVLEAVADERHTAVIKKLSQIVTNN